MREIKFIAYDYDSGKTYHDINVTFTTWGKTLIQLDYGDESLDHYLPNAVLRQYTGLKDINGVEIYEGAVVKTDTDLTCKVICTNTNSGFELYNPENKWYFATYRTKEVIGNIYENPELLKE